jgi:hypothetical protein
MLRIKSTLLVINFVALSLLNQGCAGLGGIVIANPPDNGGKKTGVSYPSYRTLNISKWTSSTAGLMPGLVPWKTSGQQPPPSSCSQAMRDFRPGTWIITRLESDSGKLEVKEKENNVIDTTIYLID